MSDLTEKTEEKRINEVYPEMQASLHRPSKEDNIKFEFNETLNKILIE